MPGEYLNVKEAAETLGVSEDEIKQMLERRELHGYRDGADWKFKPEDVRQDRQRAGPVRRTRATSLLSETELGPAEAGLSGTVIGMGSPDKAAAESDVRLADSDIQPAGASPKAAVAKKDEVAAKVSDFEELDLTLDQDVGLADSSVGGRRKETRGQRLVRRPFRQEARRRRHGPRRQRLRQRHHHRRRQRHLAGRSRRQRPVLGRAAEPRRRRRIAGVGRRRHAHLLRRHLLRLRSRPTTISS